MANQQPTYQAYTVVKREGQDDYWLNIGAAFMHQDGDGYNVVLQALPLDGKIVLRLPKAQSEERTVGQTERAARKSPLTTLDFGSPAIATPRDTAPADRSAATGYVWSGQAA